MRLLLSLAVARAPFDEDYYLQNNPDVREGLERASIFDRHMHYIAHGYFEGRPAAIEVDEEWYLEQYPDVAEGISAGRTRSAEAHYREVGEGERIPNPALAEEIRRWAEALGEGG